MKGTYAKANKVFLECTREASKVINGRMTPVKHKAYGEYVRKCDRSLREIGWSWIEYQNYVPTAKDRKVLERNLNQLFKD